MLEDCLDLSLTVVVVHTAKVGGRKHFLLFLVAANIYYRVAGKSQVTMRHYGVLQDP